jgi:hypothetical protein
MYKLPVIFRVGQIFWPKSAGENQLALHQQWLPGQWFLF